MATTSTPYGFKPINLLGGQSYAGSTRMYKIPSGYAEDIFNGDPVLLVNTGSTRGTVARFSATQATTTVTSSVVILGVFLGCTYTDPTSGQKVWRQYWPTGTVAADAQAFVADDPDALFQCQADGAVDQTMLGCNFAIIQTADGNTTTGNSGLHVDASSYEETASLPIRLVDFVNAPGSAIGDAKTDLIVRINTHFHRTATGTDNT